MAILGWRDEPTDAVEEYCQYLSRALSTREIQLQITRVAWPEIGWKRALAGMRQQLDRSDVTWVLLQYTALGWSRRGLPLRTLEVIRILKSGHARCAVVFHDAGPYEGGRWVDRFRRKIQLYVMRRIVRMADVAVVTICAANIAWLPKNLQNVVFIPVGANLPNPENAWQHTKKGHMEKPTVAVFSMTDGGAGEKENEHIAAAVRFASDKIGPVRLSVLGRHSDIGGRALREKLAGSHVEVVIHGLLEAKEVVRILGESDVMLFVRGPVSSRRGSALAGISCGLPLVATAGGETAAPLTEAGVVLVPEGSSDDLGRALLRVLQNDMFRASLREQSQRAHAEHFSWDAIATKYVAELHKSNKR